MHISRILKASLTLGNTLVAMACGATNLKDVYFVLSPSDFEKCYNTRDRSLTFHDRKFIFVFDEDRATNLQGKKSDDLLIRVSLGNAPVQLQSDIHTNQMWLISSDLLRAHVMLFEDCYSVVNALREADDSHPTICESH